MSGRRVSLITNARLFDPASGLDEPGSILFEAHRDTRDGVILALGAEVKAPKDAEVVDAQGALVCPGLIDLRAVIGEPGAEHRETYKSAGRAAAKIRAQPWRRAHPPPRPGRPHAALTAGPSRRRWRRRLLHTRPAVVTSST